VKSSTIACRGPRPATRRLAFFTKEIACSWHRPGENGVDPASAEAAALLDDLLGTGPTAPRRTDVLARIEAGLAVRVERYRLLLAIVRGEEPPASTIPDHEWLAAALRAHP